MHRTLKNLIVAVILLLCLPCVALRTFASEPNSDDRQIVVVTENITVDIELPDNEELYRGYIESLFYQSREISDYGIAARNQLNLLGQCLYDTLKDGINAVAIGNVPCALFTFSDEQILDWGAQVSFTATDSKIAFSDFLNQFDTQNVLRALLHDCPYALYWFDKVTGVTQSVSLSENSGVYTINSISFQFSVSKNYQAADSNSKSPTINTTAVSNAIIAADNANAIVSTFAGEDDYQKLLGYRDTICSQVSYDKAAASGGDFSADADPWQLISVFDNDPYTNVVCEGYSKAFQYLCDLTSFSENVSCYTVTGTTTSGVSTGGHMWNIVSINGNSYLADITNSDSGTVGQYGGLFLVGDLAGKTDSGYTDDISDGYVFKGVHFRYSDSSLSLWGNDTESILRLAKTDYNPNADDTCGEGLSWSFDETTNTLEILGNGIMADYDSIQPPWNHLVNRITTVKVSSGVTGIGNNAFSDCNGMTDVFLPDTLISIGSMAFSNCGLSTITIPSCTSSIVHDAFLNCKDLVLQVFCGSYGEIYAGTQGMAFTRLHTGSQLKKQVILPTCTEIGYTLYICNTCEERYMDNQTNPLGHNYADIVTAPTCAGQGYTTHICTRCNDQYVDSYTMATGVHTYTDNQDVTCNICGAKRNLPEQESSAIYRLYNPYTFEHLLTGEVEKNALVSTGWSLDGIAWKAPTLGVPIYRLYNPYDDFHFYTTSEEEIARLIPLGWTEDGVASYSADANTGKAVYRLFNPYAATNYHIFTASTEERDTLTSLGWRFEGTAWYAMCCE